MAEQVPTELPNPFGGVFVLKETTENELVYEAEDGKLLHLPQELLGLIPDEAKTS